MNIGLKIKELRVEVKVTQEELAKALKVSTQAVSKWECGGYPDIELIPRIAEYFNVTTDELFGLPVNDFKNIEQKLVKYMGSLSDVKERFAHAFSLCYYMEVSLNGLIDITQYDAFKIMGEDYVNSQVLLKEGIAITQLKKDKPFFALFPKLENDNFNAFLDKKDLMLPFLKELSCDDFFNALILIYSRVNNSFTENLFVKELSFSLERSKEIINTMIKFKFLIVSKLELDDKTINTYTLRDNPAVLGFFAFLDMIIERPNAFYYSSNASDCRYFDLKK